MWQLLAAEAVKQKMNNSNSTSQGLPIWAKGVIAVVVVGGVVLIGYKVYQFLKDIKEGKDQRDVIKSVKSEIKQELDSGKNPSHPMSVYRSAVNQIKTNLDDCEANIYDESNVIKILTKVVKTNLDWKILQQEWNVKDIADCMSWTSTPYELAELLQAQLDQQYGKLLPTIVGENFIYDPIVSGEKSTFDILKIYFKKIGVNF
jgi:Tfp pilus assembly protein PilO